MAQEPDNSGLTSAQSEPAAEPAKEKPQNAWQQTKEEWYSKVNLTVHQLDIIIYCALGALAVVFVLIALDAMNIIG